MLQSNYKMLPESMKSAFIGCLVNIPVTQNGNMLN